MVVLASMLNVEVGPTGSSRERSMTWVRLPSFPSLLDIASPSEQFSLTTGEGEAKPERMDIIS